MGGAGPGRDRDRAAIADVIGATLGREVENRSVSGARFSNTRWGARLTDMDIRAQFDFEPADWVVLTGGANDLGDECGFDDCAATLDEMISPDGMRGEMPEFVAGVLATGARVLWVLCYDSPEGAPTEFAACEDEFTELDARLARLAARVPGLVLADAATVIDPGNPRALRSRPRAPLCRRVPPDRGVRGAVHRREPLRPRAGPPPPSVRLPRGSPRAGAGAAARRSRAASPGS